MSRNVVLGGTETIWKKFGLGIEENPFGSRLRKPIAESPETRVDFVARNSVDSGDSPTGPSSGHWQKNGLEDALRIGGVFLAITLTSGEPYRLRMDIPPCRLCIPGKDLVRYRGSGENREDP